MHLYDLMYSKAYFLRQFEKRLLRYPIIITIYIDSCGQQMEGLVKYLFAK
jgi:hypothetical protein